MRSYFVIQYRNSYRQYFKLPIQLRLVDQHLRKGVQMSTFFIVLDFSRSLPVMCTVTSESNE